MTDARDVLERLDAIITALDPEPPSSLYRLDDAGLAAWLRMQVKQVIRRMQHDVL